MKAQILSVALLVVCASAQGPVIDGIDVHVDWKRPVAGDVRSPCPMLNTLSNHGFLNRNGSNFTRPMVKNALMNVIGFEEFFSDILFEAGLNTTGNPDGEQWGFADINQHNLLEHDGSLSRGDFFYGDAVSFSPEIFAQTTMYYTTPIINIQQEADAHLARMYIANVTNPGFGLTRVGEQNSFGESILFTSVLGDLDTLEVRRDWVTYFFEQERLPYALGWSKNEKEIDTSRFRVGLQAIINSTGGSFPPFPETSDNSNNAKRGLVFNGAHGNLKF